ncbi:unnamed protein product [Heligmosomoides polygyrus]|uniref:Prophage protein n=1 Tax=Heligmosomoides polygyrus TaxID=6339 RepID=A0A3P8BHI2_HELPZ|nr:unnamed protein product [Heligmosomoides polygyrus]
MTTTRQHAMRPASEYDRRAMSALKFGMTDYKCTECKAKATSTADVRDSAYISGMDDSTYEIREMWSRKRGTRRK